MAYLEKRTEPLSGCRYGEMGEINGTAWNSPTTLHNITVDGVIDAVFLHLWNRHTATVDIYLIVNPDDSSSMTSVDASTTTVTLGAEREGWFLLGDRMRKHGSGNNTATLAAYVDPGNAGLIMFTGHFDRITQPEETA